MSLTANPDRFSTVSNLMFLDLLGSGFSFASASSSIPSEAKIFGTQLSTAINSFISESVLGKSSKVVVLLMMGAKYSCAPMPLFRISLYFPSMNFLI